MIRNKLSKESQDDCSAGNAEPKTEKPLDKLLDSKDCIVYQNLAKLYQQKHNLIQEVSCPRMSMQRSMELHSICSASKPSFNLYLMSTTR